MVREDLSEEKHLTENLKAERIQLCHVGGKSFPRRGDSKYKVHDGGMNLIYLKKKKIQGREYGKKDLYLGHII